MAQQLDITLPEGESVSLPVMIEAPSSQQTTYGAVLLHGAGGSATSGNMGDFSKALSDSGVVTVRPTLKSPNLQYRVKVCKALLEQLPVLVPSCSKVKRWLLCGRSMGARVACQLAQDLPDISLACILLAFPLHPPSKPQQLRDIPLTTLRLPILLVRGTRDQFSQKTQWEAVLQRMESCKLEVHILEGGNHSLEVKGKGGDEAVLPALHAVSAFAASVTQGAERQEGTPLARIMGAEGCNSRRHPLQGSDKAAGKRRAGSGGNQGRAKKSKAA